VRADKRNMGRNIITPVTGLLFIALFLAPGLPTEAQAQDTGLEDSSPSVLLPAREPFDLSAYDAGHARALLYRVGLIHLWTGAGDPRIVRVRDVRAVRVGFDEGMPPGHRVRYDLELNGDPLAWDETYIRYDGRMVNLRLLFTYRNQYPPPDVEYTGRDYTW
jgi:hypothetical protein